LQTEIVRYMALLRKVARYLLVLSVPAVLMLFYNHSANWHYHMLNDGTMVKHAHPFSNDTQDNTPFQKHKHSDIELTVLAQLYNILQLLVFILLISSLIAVVNQGAKQLPALAHLKPIFLEALSLRGPPMLIS
jgi:hypothetical protein